MEGSVLWANLLTSLEVISILIKPSYLLSYKIRAIISTGSLPIASIP